MARIRVERKTREPLSRKDVLKLSIKFYEKRLKILGKDDPTKVLTLKLKIYNLKAQLAFERFVSKCLPARAPVGGSPIALAPSPLFGGSSVSESDWSGARTPVRQISPGAFPAVFSTPVEQMMQEPTTPPRLVRPVMFAGTSFSPVFSTPAGQMMQEPTTPPRLQRPAVLRASYKAWSTHYHPLTVDTDSPCTPARQMMQEPTTPPRVERPAALFASPAAWLPVPPPALGYSDAEVDTDSGLSSASLVSLGSSTRSSR